MEADKTKDTKQLMEHNTGDEVIGRPIIADDVIFCAPT